jgi:hypothetical protein
MVFASVFSSSARTVHSGEGMSRHRRELLGNYVSKAWGSLLSLEQLGNRYLFSTAMGHFNTTWKYWNKGSNPETGRHGAVGLASLGAKRELPRCADQPRAVRE